MPKSDRTRIDYMPGAAALDALAVAADLLPNLRQQALIDKLLITAVSALTHSAWQAPRLYGRDRDAWKLPDDLRREDAA